jgi:hypothetical protein
MSGAMDFVHIPMQGEVSQLWALGVFHGDNESDG